MQPADRAGWPPQRQDQPDRGKPSENDSHVRRSRRNSWE
jgi:hypothetical protein